MENLEESLLSLFNNSRFSDVISKAHDHSIAPQSSPLACRILAASYFQIGDFSQAYLLLSQLEAALGSDPSYLSLYASTARRQGDLKKAHELFNTALKLDPESPLIRNNYANLLIDMQKYDDALAILESILQEHPDYKDAIFNRNRLNDLMSTHNTVAAKNIEPSSSPIVLTDIDLGDPLLLAFDQDEVNYSNQRYFPNITPSSAEETLKHLPNPDKKSVAIDQLRFAESALKNGDTSSVLKICSNALTVLGQDSRIYDLASDAYLALNRISHAELCLLHSVAISGISLKRCLNLSNFSLMRGNFGLAEFYLSQAMGIDPSSIYVKKIRETLNSQKKSATSAFSFAQDWVEPSAKRKDK